MMVRSIDALAKIHWHLLPDGTTYEHALSDQNLAEKMKAIPHLIAESGSHYFVSVFAHSIAESGRSCSDG